MTIEKYDDMIKAHVDKKDFVKIKRTVTDGSADITGFILQMSKDFLLIQKEEEFYLNGYGIIRKDHFDVIRCNKFDKAFKRILKSEGIFDSDYGIRNKIRLRDWRTIFEDLAAHDYHVIVECEDIAQHVSAMVP
jgi:hypothetical protein